MIALARNGLFVAATYINTTWNTVCLDFGWLGLAGHHDPQMNWRNNLYMQFGKNTKHLLLFQINLESMNSFVKLSGPSLTSMTLLTSAVVWKFNKALACNVIMLVSLVAGDQLIRTKGNDFRPSLCWSS